MKGRCVSQYAIVLETYEPIEPERLAPILERTLGLVRYDAIRMAREGRGILAERLENDRATALEKALRQEGITVRCLPQWRLIRIGKPVLVRLLEIRDDALMLTLGYTGPQRAVAWDTVRFLSAGEIVEVRVSRRAAPQPKKRRLNFVYRIGLDMMLPGLGMVAGRIGGKGKKESNVPGIRREEAWPVQLADIFAGAPGEELLHVRLRSRDLYYPQILGTQSTRDYEANFRLVLAQLGVRAKEAVVSPGLKALMLAGTDPDVDPAEAHFADVIDFTSYNRWQLQMIALAE